MHDIFYQSGDIFRFRPQTPSDKKEFINQTKLTIQKMKKRLETEKNEKIRQRCLDIINGCQDTIAREQEAIKIISCSARQREQR